MNPSKARIRTTRSRRWRSVACWLCIVVPAASAAAEPPVSFSRDVKPILARRCFACHGPETGEAGLRLHDRDTALAELDSGSHAIVPGQVDASVLIDRVSAEDEFERM